jgi:hypothetical protein
MNEIDQILSNIDKGDDDRLFSETDGEDKKNDEIIKLIDSLDESVDEQSAGNVSDIQEATEQDPAKDLKIDGTSETTAVLEPEPPAANETQTPAELEMYSIRGTKSWNRREPYIIRFNPDALKNDMESLQKAFYFVDEPSDQGAIKLKIKQEIVAFMRRPTAHVTDRYQEFIYKNIIAADQELSLNFKLEQNGDKLFMYHCGPLTVYKYIKDKFNNHKYGYCYKYLPGNKAARFFPDEFIKEIVLKWFEQNINVLELPFDSIHKYEEIKNIVFDKYHQDLKIFNARLDQLNAKLGSEKTISRIKLFQLKGTQWFGELTIEIYRRFLGASIFM